MQISTSRVALAAALAAAAKAIPARPIHPSYSGVVLQTVTVDGSSVLVVTGGDGENWIRTRIACTTDTDGSLTVPGAALAGLVKDLPGDTVDLHVTDEAIAIKLAKGSYTLPRHVEEPSGTPKLEEPAFTVSGPALADALTKAGVAVAKNETLPALAGVKIEAAGALMTVSSTDRYRLATTEIAIDGLPEDGTLDVIVPAAQAGDVARLLGKAETVGVGLANGVLAFSTPDTAVFVRLLAGEFPAWRRLLANAPATWIETDTAELVGAIKRTARMNADAITLTVADGAITVAASGSELGSGSEEIAATVDPVPDIPVEIKFNPEILLDGLLGVRQATIRIGYTDPIKAVLVKSDSDHTYLAMPRR